jgi:hypothetical protein
MDPGIAAVFIFGWPARLVLTGEIFQVDFRGCRDTAEVAVSDGESLGPDYVRGLTSIVVARTRR